METVLILLILAAVFVAIKGCIIVEQQEVVIVQRLGKYKETLGAGLNFIVPFIDSPKGIYRKVSTTYPDGRTYSYMQKSNRLDLRETVYDFPRQNVITKDNVSISINAVLYFQIINPEKAVYGVENLSEAIEKLTQTTLRQLIGKLELQETLVSRDKINEELRAILDTASDKWGVKVNRIELQDITPPADIQAAMDKQMKAEREKRAMIYEAEGEKESSIRIAEGQKEAAIRKAEGEKESSILRAEGIAQARMVEAEAEKEAIKRIIEALSSKGQADKYLIAMKYLETMKTQWIEEAYRIARERYAAVGIDTDEALEKLQRVSLSLHCWQADDVTGFENRGGELTGGIQATGNYPGKARNVEELRADILKAVSYIPGTHRLNLHEIYGEFGGERVDRNEVEVKHFAGWIEWAHAHGMKLDFNSTSFSHPKSGSLSLSNPDPEIREFWIEHTKRCRAIAEAMGEAQGDPCIMNLWVHDGSKDLTVNRMLYRELLRDSLDRIFEQRYEHMKDCIESKVFGIGLESYTVGSNDFYIGYGASRGKIVTLDTGHFHPTELVADKLSSLLLFTPEVMLHVSRPVRWDSDHVTIMNDDTLELCKEIVRCDALDRVHIGLDYFDASINRIGAYVIGSRATQKCMMQALLEPLAKLREYEAAGQGFERLALLEESKSLPWNAVWDMFCLKNDVPVGEEFIADIQRYEAEVTSKR